MRSRWLALGLVTGSIAACSGEDSTFTAETPYDGDAGADTPPGPPAINGSTDAGETAPAGDGGTIDCDAEPGACLPPGVCGDSQAGLGESCDDGNVVAGDGCSPTCQVEASYWACAFGVACVDVRDCAALLDAGLGGADGGCVPPEKVPVCGDGTLDPTEACDDSNVTGGDGCSFDCLAVEADFACPVPSQTCVTTVVCGDGRITGSETCDDGNTTPGDGCGDNCRLELGWACAIPGVECAAAECGDGLVAGDEECDDRNAAAFGCDGNCRLQSNTVVTDPAGSAQGGTVIEHYKCDYPDPALDPLRQICARTTCGDGQREGTEQCDDGNTRPFDGCTPNCEVEPDCRAGECKSTCGDGRLFDFDTPADADNLPDEECDDGNLRDGDGCSSTCRVEAGFTCSVQTEANPSKLDVPVVLRDFNYWNEDGTTAAAYTKHPDFQRYGCNVVTPGIVNAQLDALGVPVYLDGDREGNRNGDCDANTPGTQWCCDDQQVTDAASFSDWYRDMDVGGVRRSRRVDGISLRLVRQNNGSYLFDSAADAPYVDRTGFYPIPNLGWYDPADPAPNAPPSGASTQKKKNGALTTELRYAFTFDSAVAGGRNPPSLTFSGDDDVWVFVNGTLALDIGGMHARQERSFTLDTAKANELGLVNRHVYEIALFHAERNDTASNFKLTLRGFQKRKSVCSSVCGDTIKTRDEQCDLGGQNASPAPYGGCSTSCQLGAYCGDSATQNPPEACDDGVNVSAWTPSASSSACGPSCLRPAYCGDGTIQGAYGERCDNGPNNTDDPTAYGSCTMLCKPGPRCGDREIQAAAGEQCDNGFNVSSYVAHPTSDDCAPQCKRPRSCGDGVVDFPFEQCDKGAANSNTGAYGSCTSECKLGPRCGDGVTQSAAGETCDDGNRVNGDGCSAACLRESNGPN